MDYKGIRLYENRFGLVDSVRDLMLFVHSGYMCVCVQLIIAPLWIVHGLWLWHLIEYIRLGESDP